MARHLALVGTLTIANGGTDSNVLDAQPAGMQALGFVFVNPVAFTGTVTVQVGLTDDGSLQPTTFDSSTSITLAAAKTQFFRMTGARQIQIKSGSAEAADRSVIVYAVLDM